MNINIDKLLFEYKAAALEHAKAATEAPQKANAAADKMSAIRQKFSELGILAQEKFLILLESSEPEVRCWAATHSLEFATGRAMAVLEKLACGDYGMISFNAQMALKEWNAGRLRYF